MGCWLGIDHGVRRIGVAAGDTGSGIASPAAVLDARPAARAFDAIARLAADHHADGVVVGLPLNMDGSEGPQARQARRFARQLQRQTGLDVRLWDERLSSFEADRALAGRYTRKQKKARQDAVAAAAFLREFLSQGGPDRAPGPSGTAAPRDNGGDR